MKNSIADYVANSMNEHLDSEEYKSLFAPKSASDDANDAKACKECKCVKCVCDDNHVHDADMNCVKDDGDCMMSDDKKVEASNLDVALDGLLKASAALDDAGYVNGSEAGLKIASLVVEAKKKEKGKKEKDAKEDKKDKKDDKKDKAADKKEDKKDKKEDKNKLSAKSTKKSK